jgi:hypothetical protein
MPERRRLTEVELTEVITLCRSDITSAAAASEALARLRALVPRLVADLLSVERELRRARDRGRIEIALLRDLLERLDAQLRRDAFRRPGDELEALLLELADAVSATGGKAGQHDARRAR